MKETKIRQLRKEQKKRDTQGTSCSDNLKSLLASRREEPQNGRLETSLGGQQSLLTLLQSLKLPPAHPLSSHLAQHKTVFPLAAKKKKKTLYIAHNFINIDSVSTR